MQAMVCELCGSNDIVKQDGLFVCQHCGTKYSLEEAKKILGTVKIDTSDELHNLYELARRAKINNDSVNAQKYYEQILLKNPSDWEAYFYAMYFQSVQTSIADISSTAYRMTSCMDTTLKMIIESLTDDDVKLKAVDEVAARCITIATALFSSAKKFCDSINWQIKKMADVDIYLNRSTACRDLVYRCGDRIEALFDADYAKKCAVPCWKTGIEIHNIMLENYVQKEPEQNVISRYAAKVRKYIPTYSAPVFTPPPPTKIQIKKGCYVATAIYGSYDCPEVWTLRRFRDDTLAETWYGRTFIRTYYAISPTLVKCFGDTEWFKSMWKPMLDKMVCNLNRKGVDNTPYNDKKW